MDKAGSLCDAFLATVFTPFRHSVPDEPQTFLTEFRLNVFYRGAMHSFVRIAPVFFFVL
jgi:hypothetical protein